MARTGTYTKWLAEEDLYCVDRFIKNYFEKLIKSGQPVNSKAMDLEVYLYNERYNKKRTEASVRLKFHNIEHLAFKWVKENGNPYNVNIKKGMSKRSKQCLKFWEAQIEQYSNEINKWLNKK
ncbi:hypothetical protein [Spiroplasma platyhelix]|uniref:Uncharacterized protein n=1 Tax=Spiroplasma platyhelix PALS-1 TaxID=1276218 RepID=A0A846UA80_9MOLU|nr:hypothetical protein [Spiroplasma platyhelix]MBE4704401.1 hypothetical protein [Spiroplasma platyhelix PALS-1]NKE38773.1 hypothetical protein [Spiroplasma platyhelix PALS-1]UJB28984.1 hypothetical protein SPLAT_v1c02190 [Spiroplasma platyhelix PALS-1]